MNRFWTRYNPFKSVDRPVLELLKNGVWKARSRPAACAKVPTMLLDDELRLLEFVAENWYQGQGAIVDAGCFLGGSTLALASGLRKNLARHNQPEAARIHSFDLFEIEDWTRGVYFPEDRQAGETTRPIFDANIADFAPLITVHEGDITKAILPADPIEILFVDVAKHWTVCDWITEHMFPRLIPGKSLVIQQDYLYHHWVSWLHITMEYYADHFEILCDTEHNSVAFLLTKPFEDGDIRPNLVGDMPLAEKIALMDRAAARFDGHKAALLESAKAQFVEMLTRTSSIPYDLLMTIQHGTMQYAYRGRPKLKNPFDLALYPMLLAELQPRTIIEIGSFQGGSALWFADLSRNLGFETHIHSVDINRVDNLIDPAIHFYQGSGRSLSEVFSDAMLKTLPRPWLIIEDADHHYDTTIAALRFFDPWLESGDYIVVEDGILTDMRVDESYGGGPNRAIQEFLVHKPGRYTVDRRYCDFFGPNVTWNINGFLKRL
jgi:cephalosporin hydroxylase